MERLHRIFNRKNSDPGQISNCLLYTSWVRHSQEMDYTYSSSFHIFPLWDQAVTALSWWAMGHPWVFALPGAALCILGFPRQRTEQPEPQTENVDSPE